MSQSVRHERSREWLGIAWFALAAMGVVWAGRPVVAGAVKKGRGPTRRPTRAEVSRIIQQNCQECHRKGEVAPFALETYEQARKRAADIATVAGERSMPPWKAVRGFGQKFQHERSLSEADISTLGGWAEAGAPLGDPAELPPPKEYPLGWKFGPPDLVLEVPEFSVPASGDDVYRCFVLPTNLPKDTYVSALDIAPTTVVSYTICSAGLMSPGRVERKTPTTPGRAISALPVPRSTITAILGAGLSAGTPRDFPTASPTRFPKGPT